MRRIEIHKSARTLTLLHGSFVFRCPIALGANPVGAKEREGDGKTPEGAYYICTKNKKSKFYKSLGISYPGEEDALRALARGEIQKAQYDAIIGQLNLLKRPAWDTALGGFIMLHGGGIDGDWTAGCIALRDADMDVVFGRAALGDPVDIFV